MRRKVYVLRGEPIGGAKLLAPLLAKQKVRVFIHISPPAQIGTLSASDCMVFFVSGELIDPREEV